MSQNEGSDPDGNEKHEQDAVEGNVSRVQDSGIPESAGAQLQADDGTAGADQGVEQRGQGDQADDGSAERTLTVSETQFAKLAINEASKSQCRARVGAVIAKNGQLVSSGFKGEHKGLHAEQAALRKAEDQGVDLHGATLYTTLEPCADSRTSRIPCSELIVNAGISEVHIGEYDRNPQVYRRGWKYLRDNDVVLRDFPADLRDAARKASNNFTEVFTQGTGMKAGAKFDFTQNGGNFEIRADDRPDAPVWKTRWGECGATAIYFYGDSESVAEARYAKEFSEIDDPDALDYGCYFVRLDVGSIGVLRNDYGHVLCKVIEIQPTPNYGGDGHPSVKIQWEIRLCPKG